MLLCVVPSTHQPMHIEDASILRNLWTFGSSDDGLSVRARIFEDIQMAPSEHFISRVASRKWHSIDTWTKNRTNHRHNKTLYILSIFTNIFLSLVPNTQTAESSRKKLSFLCLLRTAKCWFSIVTSSECQYDPQDAKSSMCDGWCVEGTTHRSIDSSCWR